MTNRLVTSLLVLALCCGTAAAPDMTVPVDVQLPLFLKILTYDRNLVARAGTDLTIAVIYQQRFRESFLAREAVVAAMTSRQLTVAQLPVRYIEIDIDQTSDLSAILRGLSVDVVYVTPLRAVRIDSITSITRPLRIRSITGVPDYVRDGIAIGVDVRKGRPEILVNRGAQLAEGADLSSQLLKLATLVQERNGG